MTSLAYWEHYFNFVSGTNITENAQRALSSDGTTLIGRWHKKQFDLFVLIFIGSIILREIMIVVY